MKLAVLSYGLPRVGHRSGGIERVAHELADGWGRHGHDVTVFSYDNVPSGAHYQVAPLPWGWWRKNPVGRRLLMGYLGHFLWLFPNYKDFDVVVSHGDSLLVGWKHPRVLRIFHGSALREAWSTRRPLRFLAQLGVYLTERLTSAFHPNTVGVSENTKRDNPQIRTVIPNGVDGDRFRPGTEKSPNPSLLFVGSLGGRKRGREVVQGFVKQIQPRYPQAELWMVSEPGPSHPGIQYFSGISEARLIELYQRAWLFLSPSRYEGFGLPYLEALATGTPVVAIDNPGSREVLGENPSGLVTSSKDFFPTVLDLLSDDEKRRALSARAPASVAPYALTHTIRAYETLFQEMLGGPIENNLSEGVG